MKRIWPFVVIALLILVLVSLILLNANLKEQIKVLNTETIKQQEKVLILEASLIVTMLKEAPSIISTTKKYSYINPIHDDDFIALSSPFGLREIPSGIYTGGSNSREHKGLDLYGLWEARIVASASGIIKDKWYVPDEKLGRMGHEDFGGYIVIDHGDGTETGYAHLSWIDNENVQEGMYVEQGQVIGRQGSTGKSANDHLHFSIRVNRHLVNPLKFISMPKRYR